MSGWKKAVILTAGTLLVLGLLVAFALPVLIRQKAVEAIREATGREARIEKISLNPLTLTATVSGFALAERDGGPFASVAVLRVSVSPRSLYRLALVLSEVSIESPSLRVVRTGPDRFNFSDIAERRPKKEEKSPAAGIFPFVLENVRLTNGSLDADDRAVPGGRKHTLRKLEITLPRLSSLPADAEQYATPRISLDVNGAPFLLEGRLKPFGPDLETGLHISLGRLELPELAVYIPAPPPVELASGRLTVDTDLLYRRPVAGKPELTVKGLFRLEALRLNQQGGGPLLGLASLEVKAARLEPLAGLFDLEAITLDGPELFVSRDRQGRWMYEPLFAAPAGKTAPAADGDKPAPAAVPPLFAVAGLTLREGRVHVRDALPREGFAAAVTAIELTAKNVTNRPGQNGEFGLSLQVDRDARLTSSGGFSIAAPAVNAGVKLTGVELRKGWPYLSSYLTAPLKGTLDVAGDVAFTKDAGLTLQSGSLTLKDFSLRDAAGEGGDLARLTVNGVAYSQQENRVEVGDLRLSRGEVSLSRAPDGRISAENLLVQRPGPAANPPQGPSVVPAKQAAAAPAGKGPAGPLAYRLKRLEIDRLNLAFTDRAKPGNPRFTLRDTALSLGDLSGPQPSPARLKFSSTFGREAPLKAGGEITPLPFRYRGEVSIGRLPIRDFEAYFPETLNLQVLGGLLDAALAVDIALPEGGAAGSFTGSAGVSVLHTVDTVAEEDLLKWERLQLDGIAGELKPFRLAIGQVALNKPYARVIVRKDGTLNLQDLMKKPAAATAKQPAAGPEPGVPAAAASPAAPAPAAPPQAEPRPISIGAVTVLDGQIKFTDNHLPEEFETTFYDLGGRISGLSSESTLLADVDLRGQLENQSPLRITGKINPLREDLFVDLKVSFTDIDLSPLTPYAGTYLGYTVEKGKLSLDLKYLIEKKSLFSENKIMIDQFTFGREVASDKATSLPVKLGLALLKDHRGEIHLDVPVTGRTDDPEFSYWGLIFQVLKNLLVKAVTAPFSLLSSLFGGGADLSAIAFAPGSAQLRPEEEKKLAALAKGMVERPALKMELTAYLDKEKDPEGYRIELLNRRVRKEKFLSLARERKVPEGQRAETVTVSPEEFSLYLKAVYAKETFPKPRDSRGLVLALPDAEMTKLILANTEIGSDELLDLARARVDAVLEFLVQKGSVAAERLFRKNDDLFKPPAKEQQDRSRVELSPVGP